MKRLVLLLLLCTVCVLPARAQSVRVVVLGSSTAEGVGASPRDSAWANRYRAYLAALDPPAALNNFGKGGYTTYHIRPTGAAVPAGRPAPDTQRNVTWALRFNPDAIIINMPSNDATSGYSVAEQLANYDEILAAAGDIPVWIATTQPRNLSAAGRANLMAVRDSTFARYGPRALDFWNGLAASDGTILPAYNSGDGIHLNNAGHGLLFRRVVAAGIPEKVGTAAAAAPEPAALRVAVFPRPAGPLAHFTFHLDAPGAATLAVYDVLGRRVARLVDGTLGAGPHDVPFHTGLLPAGVYLYRLQTPTGTATGTVTVAR